MSYFANTSYTLLSTDILQCSTTAVGCKWTERYTKFAADYDAIVGVSRDSIGTLPQDHRSRATVITSGLSYSRLQVQTNTTDLIELWRLPPNRKMLLYIGRISSEKDPQFFIDVVSHMPPDWIGVMVYCRLLLLNSLTR